MSKIACLFPGQGSQSVGMGLDLYNSYAVARQTFEAVDRTAGRNLCSLCFLGPEAELKQTINTQPTILAVSLAAWNCYRELGGPSPDYVAGHSLGEITALVAAEALSAEDAVRLVEKRAQLMENCPKGAMSAVIGIAPDILEQCTQATNQELTAQGLPAAEATVVVANFNTREQLVISGSPQAVAKAGEKAKTKGGKVIPLPVGGAFHSPLMSSAAKEFALELERATISDAACFVVQNYDGQSAKAAAQLKMKLSKQMESAVRWYAAVETMLAAGVNTFIEIGPGRVLTGMVKKIEKNARIFNIYDKATLESTLTQINNAVKV